MRLLKNFWVAITTYIFVLFGIVASNTPVTPGAEKGGDAGGGAKKDGDDKEKETEDDVCEDGMGSYDEQGGHHPMAKKAFEGVKGYDPDSALTISKDKLASFGVKHSTITGKQHSLYSAFAKTGKPLTMDAMKDIEVQALEDSNVPSDYANCAVNKAIKELKQSGVTKPARIPWN